MTPDTIDQRHYTTRELADLWNCNPETVRRQAKKGLLRSVRVGTERRYPESAVAEYLSRKQQDRDAA